MRYKITIDKYDGTHKEIIFDEILRECSVDRNLLISIYNKYTDEIATEAIFISRGDKYKIERIEVF